MNFLHPEFLYFMLPILLGLFFLLMTQKERVFDHFSNQAIEKLIVESESFSLRVRNLFFLLMFMMMVFALAAPVIEKGHARLADTDRFILVLEGSVDDEATFKKMQAYAQKIIAILQNVKIGIVLDAEQPYLIAAMTEDTHYLSDAIAALSFEHKHFEHDMSILFADINNLVAPVKDIHMIILSDQNLAIKIEKLLAKQTDEQISVSLLDLKGSLKEYQHLNHYSDLANLSDDLKQYAYNREEIRTPIYFHLFPFFIGFSMFFLLIATSSFSRGEKYYIPLLMALMFGGTTGDLHAEILDTTTLQQAKKLYVSKRYQESARLYYRYGVQHTQKEAIYNVASAYYKAGAYKSALDFYESIYFSDASQNHDLFHNIGNTLVKLGSYTEALKVYQKSLRFDEDSETRDNMNRVEAYLRSGAVEDVSKVSYIKPRLSVKKQEKLLREELIIPASLAPMRLPLH